MELDVHLWMDPASVNQVSWEEEGGGEMLVEKKKSVDMKTHWSETVFCLFFYKLKHVKYKKALT